MFSFPGRLYPITDISRSGLSHADQVAQLVEGGAQLIQLREKNLSPRAFFEQAGTALALAHSRGTKIIINDRADIALALGADGVHLGQNDLSATAARNLLGPDAIIGVSTHNVNQARIARALPITYIAIGPIFGTATKKNPDPVVGLDGLREVRSTIGDIPLVAIGGILKENAHSVLEAGADAIAVIAAILHNSANISFSTHELITLLADRPTT